MPPIPSTTEEVRVGQGWVGSEYYTLMRNRHYRPDGTIPGFIFCAGFKAGGLQAGIVGFCHELARRGYIVLSGDVGDTPTKPYGADGPGSWGNDAARTSMTAYKTLLQATHGAMTGKIGLLDWSHGATNTYGFMQANPTSVYLRAGVVGCLDTEDVRANNRASGQVSIETAYTNNAGWQTARPTHNPIEFLGALTIPQLDYKSDDDPTCTPAVHASALTAAGAYMTQVSMGSIGHSIGNLANRDHADTKAFCDWVESQLRIQGAIP